MHLRQHLDYQSSIQQGAFLLASPESFEARIQVLIFIYHIYVKLKWIITSIDVTTSTSSAAALESELSIYPP
jgi:hypothetical protein